MAARWWWGGGGTTWTDANSVGNDIVLVQVQTVYDANGNPTETKYTQRYDGTLGTGVLNVMGKT